MPAYVTGEGDPYRASTSGESVPNPFAQCCHGVGSQDPVPLEVIADADRRVRIPPSGSVAEDSRFQPAGDVPVH